MPVGNAVKPRERGRDRQLPTRHPRCHGTREGLGIGAWPEDARRGRAEDQRAVPDQEIERAEARRCSVRRPQRANDRHPHRSDHRQYDIAEDAIGNASRPWRVVSALCQHEVPGAKASAAISTPFAGNRPLAGYGARPPSRGRSASRRSPAPTVRAAAGPMAAASAGGSRNDRPIVSTTPMSSAADERRPGSSRCRR